MGHSATTSIGIGACTGASAGANTLDLDAIAGQTLTFPSTDNFWYGPNALPPIASTIVIEGRGAMLVIPADTPRRRFFFIGANAQDARTPGYNTPGAGVLSLRDAHLRGGRQRGGSSTWGGGGGFGGALYNQGILHLQRTTISDNRATGGGFIGGSRTAGGGLGEDAPPPFNGNGAGMGGAVPSGTTQTGQSAQLVVGGAGGGPDSGLAGRGGDRAAQDAAGPGLGGHGGGGGGTGLSTVNFSGGGGGGGFGGGNGGGNAQSASSGGGFGLGGLGSVGVVSGNGGGGIGGGGGSGVVNGFDEPRGGGGGGFGGGGGAGGNRNGGGDGGIGGGGAVGYFQALGLPGRGGFGSGRAGDGLGSQGGGGGGAGLGGALFNHSGVVTMNNVTFDSNAAIAGTGGSGSTSARALGGAVFNLNGDIDIDHATFTDNLAGAGGALFSLGYSGNLTAGSSHAQVDIVRSVFANNGPGGEIGNDVPGLPSGDPNFASEILTVNGSLVENPVGASVTIGSSQDNVVGIDPQLGPLQHNGGFSETRLPGPSSVAIDAVDCASPDPGSDQRGVARPQGVRCDMGSVEFDGPTDVLFADGFDIE